MDTNKNSYTFIFAGVLVVIVAFLLSLASMALKPYQERNIELEKRQNILSSINMDVEREESEEPYKEHIVQELVINASGAEISGVEAFDIDLSKELAKDPEERKFPLYVAEKNGKTYYVIPLRGKGLWGPIWGYVSLEDDFDTVYGAFFDHDKETPGLGAEISTDEFQDQFNGKKIMGNNEFTSILVLKPGKASTEHEVDGISGGTVTSKGVEYMLKDGISPYLPYFQSKQSAFLN